MPVVAGKPAGLTRQCSHSNDLPTLSSGSPPASSTPHKSFAFIRSSSFSISNKPQAIPESAREKEPIFDEIRDCDEAPYPQPRRKMSAGSGSGSGNGSGTGTGAGTPVKAEYKSLSGINHGGGSSSHGANSSSPHNGHSNDGSQAVSIPHHKKWLNRLDPRFNAKLMEERQRTIERQERERRRKREDDQMLEDMLSKWMN